MLKKIISLLIAFSVILGVNISVYAMEKNDFDISQTYEVVIPINSTEEELILDNSNATMSSIETARIGCSASRNGTTERVGIHLSYSGNALSNALRFKQLTVANRSDMIGVTYGTFGNGSSYKTYNADAGYLYYINVGTVDVPTNVDSVKITLKDAQVYCMNHAEWHSTIGASNIIEIN